jgi:hypothetical protein
MTEKVLVIISHHEHTKNYVRNIINNKIKFEKLYGKNVDFACISSNDDFCVYEKFIIFKYKFISEKKQCEKLCNFFSDNPDIVEKYDWFIRTRADVFVNDIPHVNYLPKCHISGRAREYLGPKHILNGSSINGPGHYQNIKACFFREQEEHLVLDDQIMIFDKNVVTSGIFNKYKEGEITDETYNELYLDRAGNYCTPNFSGKYLENEWFMYNVLKNRGALFNAIGIDMQVLGRPNGDGMRSGHVNMDCV